MDNFYVYMYIREKISINGNSGSPYYIGKGHGKRAFIRHSNVPLPKDKNRIIVIYENLSEAEANLEEKRLIMVYGRIDKTTGCLRNRTDGGEGQCGVIKSDKERKRISEFMKGKKYALGWKASPEQKAKLSAALMGIKRPPRKPEHTAKIIAQQIGRKVSQETRMKMSMRQTERWKKLRGIG